MAAFEFLNFVTFEVFFCINLLCHASLQIIHLTNNTVRKNDFILYYFSAVFHFLIRHGYEVSSHTIHGK